MISSVKQVYQDYYPILTEMEGMKLLTGGSFCLGIGGIGKINELCTGQKTIIPFITNDATSFNAEIGRMMIKEGCKKILPTTGFLAIIYTLGTHLLK